jgi:hypothetical protein
MEGGFVGVGDNDVVHESDSGMGECDMGEEEFRVNVILKVVE